MWLISNYYQILPIASALLNIIGYIPKIYSLVFFIAYKRETKIHYHLWIWPIWISSALSIVAYAYIIKNYYIMGNSGITALLCLVVALLEIFKPNIHIPITTSTTSLAEPISFPQIQESESNSNFIGIDITPTTEV